MAEVEYGGIKVGGSKLLLIIPLLSMLGGGAWAGFELYNEFRVLKATVMKYQPPDISGIEQNIAVIEETLISADLGATYVMNLVDKLKTEVRVKKVSSPLDMTEVIFEKMFSDYIGKDKNLLEIK